MTENSLQRLPRLLMIGTVVIALTVLAAFSTHLLMKIQRDGETRLAKLEETFLNENRAQLVGEIRAAKNYVSFMLAQSETVLMERSRAEVLKAHQIAQAIYQREHGARPEKEVKDLIRESLRNIRFFNGRGYIFINDDQGLCVLLPIMPQLEGLSLFDNRDDTGHYIMRGLIKAVNNPSEEGFSRYRWYPPHDQYNMSDKLAFVKKFEPYNWIIGAGDYLYQIEDDLKKQALERLKTVRFGEHGYLAVVDSKGKLLSSGRTSSLNGRHPNQVDPEHARKVIAQIMDAAEAGGGFIEYDWYLPNSEGPYRKISYVDTVPELDWIILAGFYPKDINGLLSQQKGLLIQGVAEDRKQLYSFLILMALVTLTLSVVFSRWLQLKFKQYQSDIEHKQTILLENDAQLQLASRIYETTNDGIMVTGADNKLLAVNRAFVDITGYSEEEVIGQTPAILQSGKHDDSFYEKMWEEVNAHDFWSGEVWNRRKNGEVYPEWLTITVYRGEQGEVQNYVASMSDISEQKTAEEKLQYLSDYDPLTQLPNRRLLGHKVEQTIALSHGEYAKQFALLYIDLDHFKNINDSLGHYFGDEVLQKIADRIKAHIGEGDTVSRLGGDHFIVLMSDIDDLSEPANFAESIIKEVALPLVSGTHLSITPSIGISVYPNDGNNFYKLLRNADSAVRFAKSQGRNNYQFYAEDMNKNVWFPSRLQLIL